MPLLRRTFPAARLVGRTAAALSLAASASAQDAPPAPAGRVTPAREAFGPEEPGPGEARPVTPPAPSDLSGAAATTFYRRPGAPVCPCPNGSAGGCCLPFGPPRPCGVGPTDGCVDLSYTGFLFYGSDPRDDDPANHTWTTCVGDQGNHGVRKTVRHVRRFGY